MIKYRSYEQNQVLQLPPDLDELIGEKELVRVVDHVINEIDQSLFDKIFKGGGCPSYNPFKRSRERNEALEKYRNNARTNLSSLKCKELRKRRAPEIETVFGDIKQNMGIKRFLLNRFLCAEVLPHKEI